MANPGSKVTRVEQGNNRVRLHASTEPGALAPWMRDRSLLPKTPPTRSGRAYEPRGER
jgi:hypothetical protein